MRQGAPTKICKACGNINHAARRQCACGEEFPRKPTAKVVSALPATTYEAAPSTDHRRLLLLSEIGTLQGKINSLVMALATLA